MRRIGLMATLTVLVVAGCPAAQAEPVDATLGGPFVLQGGQQVTITGEDLRLRFTQVLEDSRCPALVQCFWTGQARIAIVADMGGRSTPLEFNTNPAPGLNIPTVQVNDFTITLDSLDPYPQTPEDLFALEDYRATLTVHND